MTTYAEIFSLSQNGPLRDRIGVACMVAADAIRTEAPATTNNAARLIWARKAMENPTNVADAMLRAALIQNIGLTQAQILSATDAALQTAVNAAVNMMTV